MKVKPLHVIAALALLLICAAHPVGRAFIVFILPIGGKPDDVVVILLMTGLAVMSWLKGWTSLPKLFNKLTDWLKT